MNNKSITTLSSDGATVAKIIATFCVVLVHSFKLFDYMSIDDSTIFYLRGIHSFASCSVPVFFFLSGYFLTLKDHWNYQKNLKKKFKSLVIPYCLFMTIYAMISCLGALILPAFFDDFRTFSISDWLIHLVGIPFVSAPRYYGPLWFVRELIIFNVLAIGLVPIVKKISFYLLIPAMMVIYFSPLPQVTRYSTVFFILGMYCGFKKKIPILHKCIHISFLFVIGFMVPIIIEGGISWRISILFMTWFILSVSEKLTCRDKIIIIAKKAIPFSFPIYLLHEYPITTSMRLLALWNHSIPIAIVAFLSFPIIVIFVCVVLIIIWKRLLPRTFLLFTGGR